MTTETNGLTTTSASKRRAGKFSLFEHADIIAWDGEGVDTGTIIEDAREHAFTLLANSVGDELYKPKGIATADALKFITDVGAQHKRAVHVLFAGNYDVNCILRDLSRQELIMLLPEKNGTRSTITYKCRTGVYRLQWIPRKQLMVSRLKLDERGRRVTQYKAGYRQPIVEARITLWDVFGFFQGSFVNALEKWAPDLAELPIIKRGKAARGSFDTWSHDELAEYNAAELRALTLLVERVRNAIRDLGLQITRWDGAGSLAAAMLKQRNMKAHLADPLPPVERAAAFAYFGGRIERGQFGTATQVHAYDINSAYPAVIAELPDLATGHWRRAEFDHGVPLETLIETTPRFTVARVQWSYPRGERYYPFPFRIPDGRVSFPESGHAWLWMPELRAAHAWEGLRRFADHHRAHVYEAWSYHENGAPSPWGWVREYYEMRRAMVQAGQVGGAELMIKLGINSLYGKTAQTAGYNALDGRKPPYHSLALAGYITSSTRAQLFDAVALDPDAVIMLATDGVFTSRPLPLPIDTDKTLGAWGVTVYDEFASIASGVYFSRRAGRPWSSICRGYDRITDPDEIEARLAEVERGWRAKLDVIHWPSTRFVGGGTAKVSELQYRRWCCWYAARAADGTPGRAVQLIPREFKRSFLGNVNRVKPHQRLEWTTPSSGQGMDVMSTTYFLPWEVVDENEELAEMEDADHV